MPSRGDWKSEARKRTRVTNWREWQTAAVLFREISDFG